jgi:hypothetical protein
MATNTINKLDMIIGDEMGRLDDLFLPPPSPWSTVIEAEVIAESAMTKPTSEEPPPRNRAERRLGRPLAKLITALSIAVVLALFGGTLMEIMPDPIQDAVGSATEVVEDATGVELDVFDEEAASAGNWHWWTYRFNYWETRAISKWTPWGCGSSCWAASVVIKAGGWAFFALMWVYRWGAQNALRVGKCLNVTAWGSAYTGACGR